MIVYVFRQLFNDQFPTDNHAVITTALFPTILAQLMALKYILDTGGGLRDGVTRNMAEGLVFLSLLIVLCCSVGESN